MKKELLSKKEVELRDLGNAQPIHIVKYGKVFSEEKTKNVAESTFDKGIQKCVNHGPN